MPPKRQLAEPTASSNPPKEPQHKKPKGALPDTLASRIDWAKDYALSRWSKVPLNTNAYVQTQWKKLLSNGREWDDFEEAENEGDVEKQPKPARCVGGKTCLCRKPASEHPDHPWRLTAAGFAKIRDMTTQVTMRDPEKFGLTGYMDQSCIGLLQVMTNLIIDFLAAEGNWKEQWPLCEAMAIFHLRGDAASLALCEDAENIEAVYRMILYMFLSMLFNLQQARVLGPDSEVQNLERIEDEGEELTPYVLSYATKYKVDLVPKDDLEDY
ncbi:hypothetical protein N7520_011254 [Penicillium odoratum]|uniref:uncharacterized protein n=1 Tax=Penicillium odoratum TaxID=1167516 RepID=UPI00254678E0|nr:uncharacterized protein N7520_011254 [Penicillium odoratum]KAJ5746072.1 hypothetical protein N7520_011254 [Penicillium odoratum]